MVYSKSILIVLLTLSIHGCRCKASLSSQTFITNSSTHQTELVPYKDGLAMNQKSILLRNSENKSFYTNNGGIFLFDIAVDSIEVVFDETIKAVHYSFEISKSGKNPKAIKYNQPRNLHNSSSFELSVKEESKCNTIHEYKYTFTEQDYLNAK
jgi:hypothetical protein